MRIEQNSAVLIHYHLTNSTGDVIDSSNGKEPLGYLHGHHNLVVGVERALFGLGVGAKLDVEVPPDEGYGEHDPELDVAIPLAAFPQNAKETLKTGAMFQGPHPSDQSRSAVYTVIDVANDQVRCTANHPLAGVTLHFSLEVMDIRTATAAELSAGRILPPGETPQSSCCSDPNCDN